MNMVKKLLIYLLLVMPLQAVASSEHNKIIVNLAGSMLLGATAVMLAHYYNYAHPIKETETLDYDYSSENRHTNNFQNKMNKHVQQIELYNLEEENRKRIEERAQVQAKKEVNSLEKNILSFEEQTGVLVAQEMILDAIKENDANFTTAEEKFASLNQKSTPTQQLDEARFEFQKTLYIARLLVDLLRKYQN